MYNFITQTVEENTFKVTIEKEGNDVDILVNGEMVAFFDGDTGHLVLCNVS